jgi:hypothetical protein
MDEDVSLYDIAEDFPEALGAGWSSVSSPDAKST